MIAFFSNKSIAPAAPTPSIHSSYLPYAHSQQHATLVPLQRFSRFNHRWHAKLVSSPQKPDKRAFVFGMGYVGLALSRFLKEEGWDVSGTCSSSEKSDALREGGFRVFRFNCDNDGEDLEQVGLEALCNATHVISTIPPIADFDKDPVLLFYSQQLTSAISKMKMCWMGYLSSTGVYGDWQGDWVDEQSQPKAIDNRGVARIEAEQAWLQLATHGASVQIFRLGGTYGPGRSAIETVLRIEKLSSKQQARQGYPYTSRIHVDDVCQVIYASMRSPCSGRIYNVVDNCPAPRAEVFSFTRSLIKETWPNMLQNEGSVADVSVSTDGIQPSRVFKKLSGKRVSNKRITEELKVKLLYPTYESGLKAIIEEMNS